MKTTTHFKETIKTYLEQRARVDELFAPNLEKPHKNIDDCINYILNEVKKSGCNGFADEEIYGMAVHYYDEDMIPTQQDRNISEHVVVNHTVELTEEEKAEAHQRAMQRAENEAYAKLIHKPKPTTTPTQQTTQVQTLSLF